MSSILATTHKNLLTDSFTNEEKILDKIRKTANSSEELFKLMDKDFDGVISKPDLQIYLLEEHEISDANIDRLYKLIDQSKTGSINLADIKALL